MSQAHAALMACKMSRSSPDKKISSGLILFLRLILRLMQRNSALCGACVKTDDNLLIPSDLHPALPPAVVIVDVNRLSCKHSCS